MDKNDFMQKLFKLPISHTLEIEDGNYFIYLHEGDELTRGSGLLSVSLFHSNDSVPLGSGVITAFENTKLNTAGIDMKGDYDIMGYTYIFNNYETALKIAENTLLSSLGELLHEVNKD